MSYQVLARKWRPQNFKQMVGQEHVLKALIHALESQRLHHAYLFTGTRGVGKTTIGRILAKCLSCHTGITAEPCGECGACTTITEGRYVDLIEIDAASRTKVEDMRELLDNVQYAPSEGRYKIYLIDEVHMLSQSSFNALLKTLEEPPEHVKFLFATTDPQKLPVTILSRCLQFNLKNMSPERIVGHLQNILGQEGVTFEDMALWALARAADGSMRDALSLTDQAIAYGNHALTEQGVTAMLGTVDQKKIYRVLDALLARDAAQMLNEVSALAEFSPNYASVLSSISEIFHRVAIEQAVPGAVDNSMGDQQKIRHYAQSLCAEDVQLFYQIALVSRQDLAITPDPKSGLEMSLLRMIAFQLSPSSSDQASLNNSTSIESRAENGHAESSLVTSSEQGLTSEPAQLHEAQILSQQVLSEQASSELVDVDAKKKTEPDVTSNHSNIAVDESGLSPSDVGKIDHASDRAAVDISFQESQLPETQQIHNESKIASEPIQELGQGAQSEKGSEDLSNVTSDALPDSGVSNSSVPDDVIPNSPTPNTEVSDVSDNVASSPAPNNESTIVSNSPQTVSSPASENQDKPIVRIASEGWNKDVTMLDLSGMTLNLLLNSVLVEESDKITLYFESGHFRLLNANHEKRIVDSVKRYFGDAKEVTIVDGLLNGQESPMMWRERMKAETLSQAKKNIHSDTHVLAMLEEFDGMVLEGSIESLTEIG